MPITDLVGYSVDMSKVSADVLEKIQSLPRKWVRFQEWIKQIEDYCSSVGILPEDLIKCHKEAQGGVKKKKLTKDAEKEQNNLKSAAIDKKDHSKGEITIENVNYLGNKTKNPA